MVLCTLVLLCSVFQSLSDPSLNWRCKYLYFAINIHTKRLSFRILHRPCWPIRKGIIEDDNRLQRLERKKVLYFFFPGYLVGYPVQGVHPLWLHKYIPPNAASNFQKWPTWTIEKTVLLKYELLWQLLQFPLIYP